MNTRIFLVLSFLLPSLFADPVIVIHGTAYSDATVRRLPDGTAQVSHASGVAVVPAWRLSPAQQARWGFNALEARAAEDRHLAIVAQQAEQARQRQLASDMQRRRNEAGLAASMARYAQGRREREAANDRMRAEDRRYEAEAPMRMQESVNAVNRWLEAEKRRRALEQARPDMLGPWLEATGGSVRSR